MAIYNNLTKMQNKIDHLIAYANKIALALSMRQHAVNKRTIQQNGTNMFSFKIAPSIIDQQQHYQYHAQQEDNLCDYALRLVQSGHKINQLFAQKGQILVQQLFGPEAPLVINQEGPKKLDFFGNSLQSFKNMDLDLKVNRQRLKRFILTYHRKFPSQIGKLILSLDFPLNQVKGWINYKQKREKKMKLKDQLMKMSVYEQITFEKVKKLARKFYKTRLFRASDWWCTTFIRKYGLTNIVQIPQHLK